MYKPQNTNNFMISENKYTYNLTLPYNYEEAADSEISQTRI